MVAACVQCRGVLSPHTHTHLAQVVAHVVWVLGQVYRLHGEPPQPLPAVDALCVMGVGRAVCVSVSCNLLLLLPPLSVAEGSTAAARTSVWALATPPLPGLAPCSRALRKLMAAVLYRVCAAAAAAPPPPSKRGGLPLVLLLLLLLLLLRPLPALLQAPSSRVGQTGVCVWQQHSLPPPCLFLWIAAADDDVSIFFSVWSCVEGEARRVRVSGAGSRNHSPSVCSGWNTLPGFRRVRVLTEGFFFAFWPRSKQQRQRLRYT